MSITSNSEGIGVVTIKKNNVTVYEINGFFMNEYLNYIDQTIYSKNGTTGGIMATIEEIKEGFRVPDGKYSFWAKN